MKRINYQGTEVVISEKSDKITWFVLGLFLNGFAIVGVMLWLTLRRIPPAIRRTAFKWTARGTMVHVVAIAIFSYISSRI